MAASEFNPDAIWQEETAVNSSTTPQTFHGVIDGDTIHLQQASLLPAGTAVRILVFTEESNPAQALKPGEGIARAFGAWSDYAVELDRFMDDNRRLRKIDRTELAE